MRIDLLRADGLCACSRSWPAAFSRMDWSRTRRRATGSAAPSPSPTTCERRRAISGMRQRVLRAGRRAHDGYSFMSVLTHTTGRAGVGPRTNVCGFNSETWNGAATVWDQPIDWPTAPMTAGHAQFRLEHFLGSALLGHLGLPLLDHEVRASCGRRAARCRSPTSRTRRSATSRTTTRRRTPIPNLIPDKANALVHDALHGAGAQRPPRDLRRVGPHTADIRALPRLHRCAVLGHAAADRHREHRAQPERHHVHGLGHDRAQRHGLCRAATSRTAGASIGAESVAVHASPIR